MRVTTALLLAAAAAFPVAARAASQPVVIAVSRPPAWVACKSTTQCRAIWLTCHGWHPVNKAYAADLQRAYVEQNLSFLRRAECDGPGGPPPPVTCRADRSELQCSILE